MKKRLILTLLFTIFVITNLFSKDLPIDLFNKANALYEKADYSGAINVYESIIKNDDINSEVFYNLGNAYYRNHQIGYAILNYERAKILNPFDQDIKFNLSFLKEMVREPQPSFFETLSEAVASSVTLNLLTVFCLLIYLLLVLGLLINLFVRSKMLGLINVSALVLLLLLSGWFFIKIQHDIKTSWAIVVSGPCDVRNGREETSSVAFSIPEGRKIIVLSQKDNWFAVGLRVEGLRGWVENKYIKKIWPVSG